MGRDQSARIARRTPRNRWASGAKTAPARGQALPPRFAAETLNGPGGTGDPHAPHPRMDFCFRLRPAPAWPRRGLRHRLPRGRSRPACGGPGAKQRPRGDCRGLAGGRARPGGCLGRGPARCIDPLRRAPARAAIRGPGAGRHGFNPQHFDAGRSRPRHRTRPDGPTAGGPCS